MKNLQYLSLFVGALIFFNADTALAAVNDYSNYWTFDEGIGRSVGDSAGGKNGVLTGTSTGFGWASGQVGTALGMDGLQGESIVLPNGFLSGTQGSIALWLKVNSLSDRNIIFSARSTIDNYVYAALMIDPEGRPQFQFRKNASENDQKVQGSKTLNKNEWYQLVFTSNSQTYRMFLNGEELTVAGSNTGRWFPELTNQTFMYRIGSIESNIINGVFDGYVDDFRIYNRALTVDDVRQLYNGGSAGTPSAPVAQRPAITFSTSDDHVSYGGSVSLNWSTVNVTSCTASGGWSGPVDLSGSKVFVQLGSSTSYSLTCSGKGGSTSASVSVNVAAKGESVTTAPAGAKGGLSVTTGDLGSTLPTQGSATAINLTRNLQVGSRGDDVHDFQLFLIRKGYLDSQFATGYFGALTKAAAIKLQKEFMLPQTGFVGTMTRGKINSGN